MRWCQLLGTLLTPPSTSTSPLTTRAVLSFPGRQPVGLQSIVNIDPTPPQRVYTAKHQGQANKTLSYYHHATIAIYAPLSRKSQKKTKQATPPPRLRHCRQGEQAPSGTKKKKTIRQPDAAQPLSLLMFTIAYQVLI
ncbi:hypothetical protein QBC39DRAFT_6519 [Podospora conica]|nr:hypothetical protein QBC39DRAFT_6519 [Schizothecium conicum]